MSEFWSKTKSGLASAADVSKRAALRTKANGELEMLKRKLAKLKHDFGAEVFPFYESDKTKADAIYHSYRMRVEEVVAQIAHKQDEISHLHKKHAKGQQGGDQVRSQPSQVSQADHQDPVAPNPLGSPSMSEI